VEAPRSFLSTPNAGFFSSAQTGLETALLAGRPHRRVECRQRLWTSITRSSSGDAILAFPPLANLRFEVSRLIAWIEEDPMNARL